TSNSASASRSSASDPLVAYSISNCPRSFQMPRERNSNSSLSSSTNRTRFIDSLHLVRTRACSCEPRRILAHGRGYIQIFEGVYLTAAREGALPYYRGALAPGAGGVPESATRFRNGTVAPPDDTLAAVDH